MDKDLEIQISKETESLPEHLKPKNEAKVNQHSDSNLTATVGGSSTPGYIPYTGLKRSSGKFYGGMDNPLTHSSAHRLNYDGRFYATQMYSRAFFYLSDVCEKTEIAPIENALDRLLAIKGVSFNWKDSGEKDSGVIAQNVADNIPEAAALVDGRYSVNPSALIGYLIESIRELKEQINELKNGKEGNSR